MFKLEWETEAKERLVAKDVVCNKCGRSCCPEELRVEEEYFQFVQLKVQWGYYSTHDLEQHQSHLCNGCYDELIASFVVPVEVRECGPCSEDLFSPENEEWLHRRREETE